GGWPTTFTDVATGVDHLAKLDGVTPDNAVLLGHSAGGHLAAWAASRTTATPGGAPQVRPRGTISLAGVLDLTAGQPQGLGGGVIEQLLGGTPAQQPEHYDRGDPVRLVPAAGPVACIHGTDDRTVPADQSTAYVAADTAAGGTASYDEVPGDHFAIIDPSQDAWTTTSKRFRSLARVDG
ncbi:MAG: alpha/beta hydrolase, partial [Nocardioidaceae bacterium]|nr:alpha/beta hydrolase [Nocardioidaceae bacterium]